ncbi:MAG: hypothetical protein Kapaf2KO_00480 [Candidatus Kapaibacteriales bacterium]
MKTQINKYLCVAIAITCLAFQSCESPITDDTAIEPDEDNVEYRMDEPLVPGLDKIEFNYIGSFRWLIDRGPEKIGLEVEPVFSNARIGQVDGRPYLYLDALLGLKERIVPLRDETIRTIKIRYEGPFLLGRPIPLVGDGLSRRFLGVQTVRDNEDTRRILTGPMLKSHLLLQEREQNGDIVGVLNIVFNGPRGEEVSNMRIVMKARTDFENRNPQIAR